MVFPDKAMSASMSGDDFDEKSLAFHNWFVSRPGVQLSSKVAITDYRARNAGRGIVATEDIGEDEALFKIPTRIVLHPETSTLTRKLPTVYSSRLKAEVPLAEAMSNWKLVVLVLMYEYLRGSKSPWKPYLDLLPHSFDTLMFWSDVELKELQSSFVTSKIGRRDADRAFQNEIVPLIQKHPEIFFRSRTVEWTLQDLLNLAHRMASIVMAYAFDVKDIGKDPMSASETDSTSSDGSGHEEEEAEQTEISPKGMIPMADLLNADAVPNASLFYEGGCFVMRSTKKIIKDQEIFNDYGELPRSDLLRRYGYFTPNYAPFDIVEVPFERFKEALDEGAVGELFIPANGRESPSTAFRHVLNIVEDEGYLEEAYTIPVQSETGEPLPEELIQTLAILTSEIHAEPVPTIDLADKRQRTMQKYGDICQRIFQTALTALQLHLNSYPTTAEEDQHLLAYDGDIPYRKRMAVEVRLVEKIILMNTIEHCRETLEELQDLARQPPTQRRRIAA